jgi:hypothetical protein
MPLLDIWSVLIDPAWIMFGLTVAAAALGFFLLFVLYPFGRDD